MKILIVYRYFWPDTPPYATMLREISTWLAEAGHEVTVLTAQPAYKSSVAIEKQPSFEMMGQVRVRRLPLLPEKDSTIMKALNGALFILQAFFYTLFSSRRDLVWTATIPPVLQAFAVALAGRLRGARFIYHMQDIHPEIALINKNSKLGLLGRLMQRMDTYTLNRAENAIVLSDDMRQAIIARGVDPSVPMVLRNFSLGDQDSTNRSLAPVEGEPVRFVFAGNIGRFQNLDSLVKAFGELEEMEVELILVGEGRAKAGLEAMVRDRNYANVSFRDHMSAEEVFEFICNCHIGVVSLNPGLYRYAFPSKVLTYMAANLPMLAMVEDNSSLAKLLQEENAGLSISWDADQAALAEAVARVAERARMGAMQPVEAVHYYHRDTARTNWVNLMEKYANARQVEPL